MHQKSTLGPYVIEGLLDLDSRDFQQGRSTFNVQFHIDGGRYAFRHKVRRSVLGPDSETSASATFSSEQGAMIDVTGGLQVFVLDAGDYSIQADASARFGSTRLEFDFRYAITGDANIDNRVDLSDFGVLKDLFGLRGFGIPADFNGDGSVNLTDLGILKECFGPTRGAAPVPEPSTLLLATLAGIGLVVIRKLSLVLTHRPR